MEAHHSYNGPSAFSKKIGRTVRALREEKGIRQQDVADRLRARIQGKGVLQTYLSKVENGRTEPSLSRIEEIAGSLQMSIEELLMEAILRECEIAPEMESAIFEVRSWIRRLFAPVQGEVLDYQI